MEKLTGTLREAPALSVIRRLALLGLLIVALAVCGNVRAQNSDEPTVIEQQIKAAYLYKFGSYIEWPPRAFAGADSPLTIGVIGAPQVADELTRMVVNRTINGRPVAVRTLAHNDAIAGLNVLFVGRSSQHRLAEILAATKEQAVLVVTESEGALAQGSMINFVIVNNRVRFEIAPKSAMRHDLLISARLLAAAHKVASESS